MMNWTEICSRNDIPLAGARCITMTQSKIAIFRTSDDRLFAIEDHCPHKKGSLSEGIVHETYVTCPLHGLIISLETGEVQDEDDERKVKTFPVKYEGDRVLLLLDSNNKRV